MGRYRARRGYTELTSIFGVSICELQYLSQLVTICLITSIKTIEGWSRDGRIKKYNVIPVNNAVHTHYYIPVKITQISVPLHCALYTKWNGFIRKLR